MLIHMEETDVFSIRRDVSESVNAECPIITTCPRCGKEVVLNAKSPSGDEDRVSHFNCRITFELMAQRWDLVISSKG